VLADPLAVDEAGAVLIVGVDADGRVFDRVDVSEPGQVDQGRAGRGQADVGGRGAGRVVPVVELQGEDLQAALGRPGGGGLLGSWIGVRPTLLLAAAGGALCCLWLLPSPIPRIHALSDVGREPERV